VRLQELGFRRNIHCGADTRKKLSPLCISLFLVKRFDLHEQVAAFFFPLGIFCHKQRREVLYAKGMAPHRYDPSYLPSPTPSIGLRMWRPWTLMRGRKKVILPSFKLRSNMPMSGLLSIGRSGIAPASGLRISRSLADFEQIPSYTKERDPSRIKRESSLWEQSMCFPEELGRVQGTSGSYGEADRFRDQQRGYGTDCRGPCPEPCGVRDEAETRLSLLFLRVLLGSWVCAARCGASGSVAFPLVRGCSGADGTGPFEWNERSEPSVFYGTPSYKPLHRGESKEKGIDPAKDYRFRILFFSDVNWRQVSLHKKRIEETTEEYCY